MKLLIDLPDKFYQEMGGTVEGAKQFIDHTIKQMWLRKAFDSVQVQVQQINSQAETQALAELDEIIVMEQ